MSKKQITQATERWAKQKMSSDTTGHDWWHVHRVRNLALTIGKKEKANLFIVEMAALLHDVADWKLGKVIESTKEISDFLIKQKVLVRDIKTILEIIKNLSFKGAKVNSKMKTLEGKVVQDADRLDAIGAIGIARAFAYGGSKSRPIWEPDSKPEMHKTFEAYKKSNSNSINHFYEKLLLLKDMMNTIPANKMAADRHLFMKKYLDEFFKEWKGSK